jgi:hypothetical protein
MDLSSADLVAMFEHELRMCQVKDGELIVENETFAVKELGRVG